MMSFISKTYLVPGTYNSVYCNEDNFVVTIKVKLIITEVSYNTVAIL